MGTMSVAALFIRATLLDTLNSLQSFLDFNV